GRRRRSPRDPPAAGGAPERRRGGGGSGPRNGRGKLSTGAARTLDVAQFMQDLRFSRYHLQILVLCSLVTFFDGQDFAALAYALPYIRDDMGISDEMTGYVSSAAFLGQMLGSLVGSYLGDIFGRRPVIVVCTIASA